MRSQSRCAASDARRRAREFRRRSGDRRELAVFLSNFLQHVALESVRASRGLRVSSHLGAWDAFVGALLDSFIDGPCLAPLRKHRVAFRAMAHAAGDGREFVLLGQTLRPAIRAITFP